MQPAIQRVAESPVQPQLVVQTPAQPKQVIELTDELIDLFEDVKRTVNAAAEMKPFVTSWEYMITVIPGKVVDEDGAVLEQRLNVLGSDGWELAHVESGRAILKRPRR